MSRTNTCEIDPRGSAMLTKIEATPNGVWLTLSEDRGEVFLTSNVVGEIAIAIDALQRERKAS